MFICIYKDECMSKARSYFFYFDRKAFFHQKDWSNIQYRGFF